MARFDIPEPSLEPPEYEEVLPNECPICGSKDYGQFYYNNYNHEVCGCDDCVSIKEWYEWGEWN